MISNTHTWGWWTASPELLSKRAAAELEASPDIGVAAISCWEIAMLVEKDRMQLDRDTLTWLKQALAQPKIRLIDLSPEIAVATTRFEKELPGDPADRLIAATAQETRSGLVTKDRRLRALGSVRTVW